MSFLIRNFFSDFSQVLPIYLYLVIMFLCFLNVLVTRIHWLDRRIVRKQLDIMPTYHYVQNQGTLMMQSPKNGHKHQFGQFFYDFEVKYLQIVNFSEKKVSFKLKDIFSTNFTPKTKKIVRAVFEKKMKVSSFWANLEIFSRISPNRGFFSKIRPCGFSTF